MNYRSTLICIATFVLLSSHSRVRVFAEDISNEQYECPDENAAFVTTCSGGDGGEQEMSSDSTDDNPAEKENIIQDVVEGKDFIIDVEVENEHIEATTENINDDSFDDSDLVNEVLHESSHQSNTQTCTPTFGSSNSNNNSEEHLHEFQENTSAMLQLQHTFVKLTHRYYDPLPAKAKCAVGTVCGFVSSRIALGVANRIVRLTGAIWVASEVLHTSGFCDETKCVPEEMRPWIGIIRRALIKQCMRVRLMARRIYNQERIREIAQKDGMFAGGFASGAFVGFVV
jgi:hypothetical protein